MNEIGINYNAIAGADYRRRSEDGEAFEQAVRDEIASVAADIDQHGLEAATELVTDWIADPAADLAGLLALAGRTASTDADVGRHIRQWLTLTIEHASMAKVARDGWE